jgi:NADP-dependent aldehyde dehydrogenase
VGRALVTDPGIKAVGFTGSLRGGRALYDLAASRPEPIPVYAEMGSVNPFLITETALVVRGAAVAKAFTGSMTQSSGQFCTKPGLAFVPTGAAGDEFVASVIKNVNGLEPGYLLNSSLLRTLASQVDRTRKLTGVAVRVGGAPLRDSGFRYPATVIEVSGETFLEKPELREEYFGPFAVIVRYESLVQLSELVRSLAGNLTAKLHAEPQETTEVADLVDALREKVGRLVWNGYPTGVAVTHSMVHGGPYPATTPPWHTSVGSAAIKRFMRPVAYQSYPAELLPLALRDDNPLGILRMEDGKWVGGTSLDTSLG